MDLKYNSWGFAFKKESRMFYPRNFGESEVCHMSGILINQMDINFDSKESDFVINSWFYLDKE